MSDEKKLHRISGSSLLLNENEENPNSYEQTTKCKVGQIKVSESDESNSESCPGIFSGLSDLSPNNRNLTFYSDSYRYGYTICFQYSLQVRTSSENRTKREKMLLRQMDAAEKLETIRERFNLTETDPLPEQVINVV